MHVHLISSDQAKTYKNGHIFIVFNSNSSARFCIFRFLKEHALLQPQQAIESSPGIQGGVSNIALTITQEQTQ